MNCRIKFGLVRPTTVGRPTQFFFYNSLSVYNSVSAAIHLHMIRPIDAWTNFAKHGNPTPDPKTGFIWTPFESIFDYKYLNISGQNPIMSMNNPEILYRMELWERVLGE